MSVPAQDERDSWNDLWDAPRDEDEDDVILNRSSPDFDLYHEDSSTREDRMGEHHPSYTPEIYNSMQPAQGSSFSDAQRLQLEPSSR